MRTLGNILWLVLAGFWLALGYAVAGVITLIDGIDRSKSSREPHRGAGPTASPCHG